MEVASDTEEYEINLVSSALDASASISLLMQYFTDGNIDHIIEMASLARDSVDMYIQDIECVNPYSSDLESRILKHPLMQCELTMQRI